jgi:antitoxin component YwqK of YwqJK toxin-antitoxin module
MLMAEHPSGKMVYTEKNGRKTGEYFLVSGVKTGVEKYWDGAGDIAALTTYSNGVVHGDKKQWRDGRLVFHGNYLEGKEHGTFTNWYDTGQIFDVATYSNGVKHGEYMYYSPTGRKLGHCVVSNWFTLWGTDVIERTSGKGTTLGEFTNGVLVRKWHDWEEWQ